MAFSDFKSIAEVQTRYNITYQDAHLLTEHSQMPPEGFAKDFEFNRENIDIFTSEASRSEIIISPLLREVYKNHYQRYSFWIQKSIAYDHVLSGTPDYIFSKRSDLGKTVLEKPILIVVEAKKNDFEQGWGQCLAELLASQKINDNPSVPVYGIVTDGNLWQFGQLKSTTFTKDIGNFTIDNLPMLYGTLEALIQLVDETFQHL